MQIIAHRGASKHAPENTLEAFTYAYNRGIHFIECDLAMSQDGVLYIIHDDTFNRTTNAHGPVWNANWDKISKQDAGSWFSAHFHFELIEALKQQNKDWRIAALSMNCNEASIQRAKTMGCDCYNTSSQSCSSLSWIENIHQQLKSWVVDFVFTDDVLIDNRCIFSELT